jgi:hypothetical protein
VIWGLLGKLKSEVLDCLECLCLRADGEEEKMDTGPGERGFLILFSRRR